MAAKTFSKTKIKKENPQPKVILKNKQNSKPHLLGSNYQKVFLIQKIRFL